METEITPPLPHRAYGTSAGLDLFCGEENIIDFEPMDGKVIRTGYRIHQNKISSFGLILGRSSLNAKGIFVTPGVIDNDYTGELFINVLNLSKNKVSIKPHEKIAQIVFLPYFPPYFKLIANDTNFPDHSSVRGTRCLGSSNDETSDDQKARMRKERWLQRKREIEEVERERDRSSERERERDEGMVERGKERGSMSKQE